MLNILGTKVVLFCVKADFNGDEVCLSFCGDNGVRSVLLNAGIQYPLVQVRDLQEFYIASKLSASYVVRRRSWGSSRNLREEDCVTSSNKVCVGHQ